jgi:hypothetical protein
VLGGEPEGLPDHRLGEEACLRAGASHRVPPDRVVSSPRELIPSFG